MAKGLLYILYKAYARLDAANSIRSFPNAANGYTRSGYKVSVVVNYTLPRRLSAITNDTHCPDGFWKDDELTWENSTAIPTQIAEYEQFVKGTMYYCICLFTLHNNVRIYDIAPVFN
ncbi:hypothetical protein MAR_014649 [Mya arenaria]|uniref:Uncharacterized protein n=1 Tax=Mya arenaria TaxID=6604 RepID=A0ABY7FEQ3_MYAAR|nr:hypothetical protein MAR_014649 [Mya arenaria]